MEEPWSQACCSHKKQVGTKLDGLTFLGTIMETQELGLSEQMVLLPHILLTLHQQKLKHIKFMLQKVIAQEHSYPMCLEVMGRRPHSHLAQRLTKMHWSNSFQSTTTEFLHQ